VAERSSTKQRSPSEAPGQPRIILLSGAADYRLGAFRSAAERLGIDVIYGADIPRPLEDYWHPPLGLDFNNPEAAAAVAADFARNHAVQAILATDDSATLIAALASKEAGIPHNDPDASLAARDKLVMRDKLAAGGVRVPWYRAAPMTEDPSVTTDWYPCVVKPTRLSGSRGVIRANDDREFAAAFDRTRALLRAEGADPSRTVILVEQYVPGVEVAVEALLTDGTLNVLAIFDKPDPLEGPIFEETIYVTPSRLPEDVQLAIAEETAKAAAAIGLVTGPVHAELRINESGPWLIELAGRSIGGHCSTILEFGSGQSLEELILANAVGMPVDTAPGINEASGVMMIPIPKSGVLRCVEGQEEALAIEGITGIDITAQYNARITTLPEGASYLGFIFARSSSPEVVEESLRAAHGLLRIRIDELIPLARVS
jgi:biotin carboxylase